MATARRNKAAKALGPERERLEGRTGRREKQVAEATTRKPRRGAGISKTGASKTTGKGAGEGTRNVKAPTRGGGTSGSSRANPAGGARKARETMPTPPGPAG